MKIKQHLPELVCTPAVFAVKDHYQIMVPVKSDVLFWVTVGGVDYHDHSNGIIRSSTRMHRVSVPMSALDNACEYTINYRKVIERRPYYSEMGETMSETYSFKPVRTDGPIKIYHLSDTHGNFEFPASAGSYFGDDIDLLILNGDIPNHSGDIENFNLIFTLCEHITGGKRPCVFSRGNHDTRGFYAENIAEYTPTENGHSYFTFRLGKIWGIVMDTGEDKPDDHPEYTGTVCCHEFRMEETEYLLNVIKNANEEYLADGIEYRFVIAHNPFSFVDKPPFDIEQPLFTDWLDLLEKNVKPQVMICGHIHDTCISYNGGPMDSLGQICPVIVGSNEVRNDHGEKVDFIGCAMTLDGDKMKVEFTNKDHKVIEGDTINLIK